MPVDCEKTFERPGVAVTVRVTITAVTADTFEHIRTCLREALAETDLIEQAAVKQLAKAIHDHR